MPKPKSPERIRAEQLIADESNWELWQTEYKRHRQEVDVYALTLIKDDDDAVMNEVKAIMLDEVGLIGYGYQEGYEFPPPYEKEKPTYHIFVVSEATLDAAREHVKGHCVVR